MVMTDLKDVTKPKLSAEEQEKADKKKFAEEYCKTIEAKLRKAERSTWMIKDHDHLHQ